MAWIIDYPVVLEQMHRQHYRCLYYNSGAFGFPREAQTFSLGWALAADPTIRPEALGLVRIVTPAEERTLAKLARQLWQEQLPGRAWVMPKSHWAYELEFGGPTWLPALVESIELDPGLLQGRNNAAAIEFATQEGERFEQFIEGLLRMLQGSDWAIAFPGHPVLGTVHHHQQVWWTSSEARQMRVVEQMTRGNDEIRNQNDERMTKPE